MEDDFINLVIQNIEKIKKSPSESLKNDGFIDSTEKGIFKESIIDFLLKYDYIETEDKDDIYFLTPENYVITNLALKQNLSIDFYEEFDSENIHNDTSLDEDEFEIDELDDHPPLTESEIIKLKKLEKEQRQTDLITKTGIIIIACAALIWFGLTFEERNFEHHTTPQINQEMLQKLKIETDHLTDSINRLKK